MAGSHGFYGICHAWIAWRVAKQVISCNIRPMAVPDLPALERRLTARLIELERLYEVRPGLPHVLARAAAGQRIDELLNEIEDLEREITLCPTVTLEDAAVKLRRLSVYLEGPEPARLLAEALEAVERAAVKWREVPTRA